VRLIETGENLGLAGGIDAGLPAALDAGARWVFLLNNDTIVNRDLFSRFSEAVEKHPDIAIWGPRIVYYAEPERVWFLAERRVAGTLLGRPVPETDMAPEAAPVAVPADFISGCAMLVRQDVFETIGDFDASLFLFAEEVDFCLRAGQAGFRLAAAPRAGVRHKVSLSTDRDRPGSRFHRIRNQARVYRRYASVPGRAFYFLFTLARTALLALSDLLRGERRLAGVALRGWWAGWFST
jgi:GT2 family glycosyltransferase